MAIEQERKFILGNLSILEGRTGVEICQGYLTRGEVEVRVRRVGDIWTMGVKIIHNRDSRYEYEMQIPREEAEALLALCCPILMKTRYRVECYSRTYDVDVYHGANEGLATVELEIAPGSKYPITFPPWVGEEVTGDSSYSAKNLK